jgi:hypothetical protein
MQVPNAIVVVAAEINIVLLVCAVIFFIHSRKLKSLVRRQQDKLLELLKAQKTPQPEAAPIAPAQSYKNYLNNELDATSERFNKDSPGHDIALELSTDSPILQRILALRYAFLRAEELGTTEDIGTPEYWSVFQQALTPLLAPPQVAGNSNAELEAELETAKKRIENLEKFKHLFFDMEKQWGVAQNNAQNYYEQLLAMSEGVADRPAFNKALENYHGVYDSIQHNITQVIQNQDSFGQNKIINITRQNPHAAEEIVKLRNVAADQHRIINDLQRKLSDASTTEEKEVVIQELQQQLQRQIRFVHESETCIQLLEDELAKAHEEISLREQTLDATQLLSEENKQIKSTLHNFTLESKDLLNSINDLEEENVSLKQNMNQTNTIITENASKDAFADVKKIHAELVDMKKQYAELEERYLDLKLGN